MYKAGLSHRGKAPATGKTASYRLCAWITFLAELPEMQMIPCIFD